MENKIKDILKHGISNANKDFDSGHHIIDVTKHYYKKNIKYFSWNGVIFEARKSEAYSTGVKVKDINDYIEKSKSLIEIENSINIGYDALKKIMDKQFNGDFKIEFNDSSLTIYQNIKKQI